MNTISFRTFIKDSLFLITTFIFVILLVFLYFTSEKNNNIENYLNSLKNQYITQYAITYENFNKLAQNSFYGIINKPEIYNLVKQAYQKDEKTQKIYRDQLYEKLIADYTRLNEFNFKQMQFHFPDNSSFLRMHKPEIFGDSLVDYRHSVEYVNKELKPINGYEIGKIIDGFRFVYPLFDEELFHIGSVELSVDSRFFDKSFEKGFNVDSHFLVKKSIAQNKMFSENFNEFEISYENSKYIYSENVEEENIHYVDMEFYSLDEKASINQKMENSETFIIYKKYKNSYLTVCFLPIIDTEGQTNTAYMVLYKYSDVIEQIKDNYFNMIVILILFILFFIFYIRYKYIQIKKEKNKEYIYLQQTKMVALGEMIQNISHQWRQPLSVISILASGLKLKKECDILEDKEFYENLDGILKNTNYLSQTIEDFRNYFDESLEKKNFNLKNLISQSTLIFKEELNAKDLILIENTEDIDLYSYEHELKQVLINLLKNAKDFTKEGVIIINAYKKKNQIKIEIQDSAGGIPRDIIKKIFEPYFTTKHNSLGIGLGLFSSYEIVNNKLKGNLIVQNKEFTYNFKTYKGACFSIILDINKL